MGCGRTSDAQPIPEAKTAAAAVSPAPAAKGESCLGLADKGVFSDLDDKVQLALPAKLAPERVTARVDDSHHLLVLSIDGYPRKAYPLGGSAALQVGKLSLALRPGDRAELQPLLAEARMTSGSARDHDKDGIPDPLDLLIGAKKTVINADAYTEKAQGYIVMKYPGGDVDRSMGVCTDVIIRSVRNAGLDLQKELHEDILARRSAFPMIRKGKGADANIDHRRVGTLLPYFKKHWEQHSARLDDPDDPLRPGDIILMDTFPSRSGPDHIGIISDTVGDSGLPLVINNWTNGTVTAEMDLLTFVPVLYRFRLPA
ncbi:MAG: DUF1287 domain-containing protein [Kofleriaceae bacterium]|nr:DUF1287 domain-containing protein [Kofleriaceae bacterium]